MNILIVDDSANNRMIIRLLLEDYEEEQNETIFKIEEASNGLEAVQMCENGDYDMVLMDIMMPEMDGIEATRIIRESDSKIMIVAISAVDDSGRQKMILNNGAEDYIVKPVNADIFKSRMVNYITLLEARKHKKSNLLKINLYSEEIYSRNTNFIINSEDALSEFWEFFLLNANSKYDNLSDVVRTVFSIAETQLRLSIDSNIFVEEANDYQYFTLINIDKLPAKVVELILKKNLLMCPYKIEGGKISFELAKVYSFDEEEMPTSAIKEEEKVIVQKPVVLESHETSKELQVFNYLDEEDLVDLEEYASKLNSLMLIVGSGDVSEEEIVEMYTFLDKIGSVLSTYSEIYSISKALTHLSKDLSTHTEEFIQNSKALGPMCKAFSNDMSSWIQMSFHTGAPSIDFMNDTIVVNCNTISNMLNMDEQNDSVVEDLDDIFDF